MKSLRYGFIFIAIISIILLAGLLYVFIQLLAGFDINLGDIKLDPIVIQQSKEEIDTNSIKVAVVSIYNEKTILVNSNVLDINIQQSKDTITVGDKTIDVKGYEVIGNHSEFNDNGIFIKIELMNKREKKE